MARRRLHGRSKRIRRGRALAGLGAGAMPGNDAGRADRDRHRERSRRERGRALFEASINAADRFIYIENQFTSATDLARLLAQRMLDVPQLRVLIVTPKMHSSWFDRRPCRAAAADSSPSSWRRA